MFKLEITSIEELILFIDIINGQSVDAEIAGEAKLLNEVTDELQNAVDKNTGEETK